LTVFVSSSISRMISEEIGLSAASARKALHADEEPVREVTLEPCGENLAGRRLDIVLDSFELEAFGVGVVNRIAGAVIVIARLAHRAHAYDVFATTVEHEIGHWQLFDRNRCQCEDLAKMRVSDDGKMPELVPYRQKLARLLGSEDVLELLDANR